MRASSLGRSSVIVVLAAAILAACSATNGPSGFTSSQGSGGVGSGTGGSNPSSSGQGGTTTITGIDAGTGGSTGVSSAYAHTNDTLFKLDPSVPSLAITQIGKFDCLGGTGQDSTMTDIAVNEAGDVWAVSSHNVYKLTLPAGGTGTVHCASTFSLTSAGKATFYGLSFAPVGVLDPSKEILVAGNTAGEIWAIDVSTPTPTLTQHGTFGKVPANDGHGHNYMYAGTTWELSGDLVFLANNGSPIGFATVRDCSSTKCNTTDTLVELDLGALKTAGAQPVIKSLRGQVVKAAGCNDPANSAYGGMYGIAAYQDKVFGFSHSGFVVTINNNDGTACLAAATSSDLWAGAAITTVAPVTPPTTQ